MTTPHPRTTTRNERSSPGGTTSVATAAQELEIVARMTRILVDEWDADVVMGSLVREAAGLLGARAVVLWVTDATSARLSLAYSHGIQPADGSDAPTVATYDLESPGILSRAAHANGPIAIRTDAASDGSDPLLEYARAHQLAALLLVPLLARERLLGILCLTSGHGDAFDGDGIERRARLFADLFALAIESTGLQERLRETNARLVTATIEAQQRADELADEKQEREAFISLVAHELKNPLAVLKMHISLMQRGTGGKEKQAVSLATMANNANRLQRLIDDLLDASRIAAGHFAIETAPADVVAIAREVTLEHQATTQRHVIQFVCERGELECICDRERLTQALNNLVTNAIKYSPEGGEIILRVTGDEAWARLSVEDHGAGLSDDDRAHLFEPYSRILRVREAKGTGLGLFVTKGIVEAHGGTIEAHSPGVGQGSTFIITIPRSGIPAGSSRDVSARARSPD